MSIVAQLESKRDALLEELNALKGESTNEIETSNKTVESLERKKQDLINELTSLKEEANSPTTVLGDSVKKAARAAGLGTLDLVDFVSSPARAAINVAASALGSEKRARPLAESAEEFLGEWGAPRNDTEKTIESIGRVVSSLPAGGAIAKGIPAIGTTLSALKNYMTTSNAVTPTNIATAAAVSGLTQNALNEKPEELANALGQGVLGGAAVNLLPLLTQKGRGAFTQNLGKTLSSKLKFNPNAAEDFSKAGLSPLLSDVSESSILKKATNSLGALPIIGTKIKGVQSKQYKDVLERLGQGDYGNALSRTDASKLTTAGARAYQKQQNRIHSTFADKVEKDIASLKDQSIIPANTGLALAKIKKNIGENPFMRDRFDATPLGKTVQEIKEALDSPRGLTYNESKEILDTLNDKVTTFGTIGKASQGKIKYIAKALAQDIDESISPRFLELGKKGKESLSDWKTFKNVYHNFAEKDIPRLNELYRADKTGATDAFLNLVTNVKKGGEKLKIAMEGLEPQERLQLTNSVMHKLGSNQSGQFSPVIWAKNFNTLEPQAKKIVLSPLGKENGKKIMSLLDSIGHIKSTLAEANTSKTSYHNAMYAMLTRGTYSVSRAAYGDFYPIAKDVIALMIGRIGAKALTSPKIINWLYDSSRVKNIADFEKRLQVAARMKGIPQTLSHASKELISMIETPPS